jgi:hypothetical protein
VCVYIFVYGEKKNGNWANWYLFGFWIEGGKLVYQTTKKRASGPKCPVTGKRIQGVFVL